MIFLWVSMWILLGLLGLAMVVFIWLLLAPIALQINSRKNIYQLHWMSIGFVRIEPNEEKILIFHLKLWFWNWKFDVLHPPNRVKKWVNPKKKKSKEKKKKKSFFKVKGGWQTMGKILRSFRIVECRVNFDTGNPVWNAWLYPLAAWVSSLWKATIEINWVEQQDIEVDVRITGWRIARAIFFK